MRFRTMLNVTHNSSGTHSLFFKKILSGNQEPITPTIIGIMIPKLEYFDNSLSEVLNKLSASSNTEAISTM